MLKGALDAKRKVLLKLNVAETNLSTVVEKLPGLHAPTINRLADDGWVAVEAVIDESEARQVIPGLKTAGAEGIIELPQQPRMASFFAVQEKASAEGEG